MGLEDLAQGLDELGLEEAGGAKRHVDGDQGGLR
jgi:hypothetical protein